MSTWRDKYKVHPAADVFPMMSDEEITKTAEDIKTNGLRERVTFWRDELIDGRNRMAAMKIAGIKLRAEHRHNINFDADPVPYIISANIRRRQLTSGQLADVLVKLAKIEVEKETGSSEPVSEKVGIKSPCGMPLYETPFDTVEEFEAAIDKHNRKGGRGKKSPIKAKVTELNDALPEDQRISESTVKRAIAKAEGKKPAPKKRRSKAEIAEARKQGADAVIELAVEDKMPAPKYTARPMPKPKSGKPVVGIDAVRQCYLDRCAEPDVDLDAEQELIIDALREIAGKRAMRGQT